jgi:ABC-type antimicrobial peptide transport system permease subunit
VFLLAPPEGGVSERAGLADTDLPISTVYIATDGTPAAENRVRTQAATLVPNAIIHTQQDRIDRDALFFNSLEQLQRLVWYFVLIVAACGLTVGMLAGVIERRRPFALLRASGLRLLELRQVVLLETAAAMFVTAAVSVGLGMASSYAVALSGDMAGRRRLRHGRHRCARRPHPLDDGPPPAGHRDPPRRRPVRVAQSPSWCSGNVVLPS